jgi:hypothetical protein
MTATTSSTSFEDNGAERCTVFTEEGSVGP